MALEARVTHADVCFSRFPHRLIMKGLLHIQLLFIPITVNYEWEVGGANGACGGVWLGWPI